MHRVTVVGSGFGGLTAVQRLRWNRQASLEITLVSPKDEFVYLPGACLGAFGAAHGR